MKRGSCLQLASVCSYICKKGKISYISQESIKASIIVKKTKTLFDTAPIISFKHSVTFGLVMLCAD